MSNRKYKFHPRGPVALVRPKVEEELMDNGLYKPNSTKEQPTTGEVLDVDDIADIKVGEVVCFKKYVGLEWIEDDETLLILKSDEIIGWSR